LRKLFDTPDAWEMVILDADQAARLPGVGLGTSDLRHAG
jgi:hypothetical protein